MLALNKSDLLIKKPETDSNKVFLISAKTGEGIDNLLDHIVGYSWMMAHANHPLLREKDI